MERSQYLEELKALEESIKSLKDKYVTENAQFAVGAKIVVTKPNSKYAPIPGIVVGNKISYQNNVEPLMVKEKKDGTASAIALTAWYGDKIELR